MIVEDIYDSGNTFETLALHIQELKPKDVQYCIAFHKKNVKNLKYNFKAKYTGFYIPDLFVFGYGMDYNERFREMSHLCIINEKGK